MPQRRVCGARIHPNDAMAAGLEQGDDCVSSSPTGSIRAPVMVTEDVSSGTIAVPHGWGHNGGWQRANTAGGANSNDLASPLLADLERLASMSILNGIPVRLERPPDCALRTEARRGGTEWGRSCRYRWLPGH